MQSSLRLSLSLSGVAALVLAGTPLLPAVAEESAALLRQQEYDKLLEENELLKQRNEQLEAQISGSSQGKDDAFDLQEINLKDAVKFNWGFQGALQGAGTPNQTGIGGFLPIAVGESSVFFADVLLNANFADYGGKSSIVNTEVAGTTISTSSRLGYRWLNSDRSWMYGLNGGYDSRPMNTGGTDTGIIVSGTEKSAFFQQIAAGLEAVSDTWNFNAYALIPVGDTEQRLNARYFGGALDTYGLDVGYFVTPELNASVGYYYQSGDLGEADGSGVQVELDYQIADGLTAGINVSYDEAFETRVSGNIEYRFGSNSSAAETKKKAWQKPTIQALSEAVKHRNIRVHDAADPEAKCKLFNPFDGRFISSLSGSLSVQYLYRSTAFGTSSHPVKYINHCNKNGGWERVK
ncbi:carbamoyl-phosphate synthase [Synechococcus sp. MVIR-18-1]|uniref:carbamoyl-phosphate synthase n=1 Tax=Synechococcus sp. MVIR-18-1 TaxID=1386941 RepID=UPI0018604544|nr:carbamoyl-phosphate synthase [Synechococcus sp. MVIR-18-1]QNI76203.1 putative carbamoyl-phosphate synthase L chain [Synechococcus sp. MVIR-18-1]